MIAILATSLLAAADAGTPDDIADVDLLALLDTPVASVSRTEEKASLAAADVFVVTREDLERHGFRSLDEVLRYVPGLFVDDDTLFEGAGIHGLHLLGDNNTRILVLLDGHPLNNQVGTGQSYLGRDLPVTVASLERVEVIKGPVGGIYGPIAYFGVVNLVTRGAAREGGEAAAHLEQGNGRINGGEATLAYGRTVGPVKFSLNGGFYRSAGFDYAFPTLDRPLPPDGVVRDRDWRQAWNLYGTVEWQELSLRFGFSDRRRGLPTAPYSTIPADPRSEIGTQTLFAQLGWEHAFTNWFTLTARLSYDDFAYFDDLAYPDPPDDLGLFKDRASDRWISGEVRATFTPRRDHRDVLGVEVQHHLTRQHSFYEGVPSSIDDPVNGFGVGPIAQNFTTVNAYALVEQSLGDVLRVQGGLTFYAHSLFGARLTPKVGLVWTPSSSDVVKGVYSEGFRPPTMFEAFFEDGLDFIPNAALRPENARSVEAIWEHRFVPQLAFNARVFADRFEQLIMARTVPQPGLGREPMDPSEYRQQYQNAAVVNRLGGELGVLGAFEPWVRGWVGLSMQGADFSGAPASNFAPWLFTTAVSTRAAHPSLSISARAVYVDKRTVDLSALTTETATVEPYVWVDLSARWEVPWVKGLSAQLTVLNLFDSRAEDPVVADHAPLTRLKKTPREARLTARYAF